MLFHPSDHRQEAARGGGGPRGRWGRGPVWQARPKVGSEATTAASGILPVNRRADVICTGPAVLALTPTLWKGVEVAPLRRAPTSTRFPSAADGAQHCYKCLNVHGNIPVGILSQTARSKRCTCNMHGIVACSAMTCVRVDFMELCFDSPHKSKKTSGWAVRSSQRSGINWHRMLCMVV